MSLEACLADLKEKGVIGKDQSAYLRDLYGRIHAKMEKELGPAAAEAAASDATLEAAQRMLNQQKRALVLSAIAQHRALADMDKYKARAGKWDFGRAAEALYVRNERGTKYMNAEYQARVIHQTALGKLRDLIAHHAHNVIGEVSDKAGLIDLLKAIYGEKTDNSNAAAFAKAWAEVAEFLRNRANAAGASIAKLDDWRLPQVHDAVLTREAAGPIDASDPTAMDKAYAAWSAAEIPRLDRTRMLDRETGAPLDDEGLDRVMRAAFDNIVSDGWVSREEGAAGSASIAARLSRSRVLVYKDAASWLASHSQFGGTGTVYDVLMGHIAASSRDIALLERFGPNPAATNRWLQDVVRKRANVEQGAGSGAAEKAHQSARRMQGYYDTLSGASRMPDSRRLAQWGATLRNWQGGTKLGSAALSTTSDVATGALTRAYNGLPMADIVTGYAKYLNPLNEADRMHAARMGFIAENAGTAMSGTARMLSEEMGHEVVHRIAQATMRLSALDAITEAGRASFGEALFAQISRDRALEFGALDPKFRGMFERYGMEADAWDAIRSTPVEHAQGADWILHENIANRRLADNVLRMAYQEMDVAVPTSGIATRAMLDRVAPRGTWLGEGIRTLFQFKAFPVTLMMIQWQRALARDSNFDRLMAFGLFFGASALAGAFSLQMKEIAKGRNPRPMASGDFLLEAIAQGGGAGIYGDFVRSTDSRFGSGPLQVVAGPGVQTVTALGQLTTGNLLRAAKGEPTHVSRDAANFARSETPLVGSLWYTRLAYERGALDVWRRAADPMAAAAFRRMESKYRRTYGQDYFWRPGQPEPDQLPQFGNVFDAPPQQAPRKRQGW